MTLKQVIDMVDAIKPNAFDEATKTIWINEVEGFVQTEVFLLAVEDVIEYAWPTDQNTELLVEPPHSKLYWTYLSAMVDFANGEYSKYNNTMQVYNAFMSEYMRWFAKRYRPADGRCIEQGYYISAYGIAVKHGYTGSEEDWIASLKGEKGDKGDPGEKGEKGDPGEPGADGDKTFVFRQQSAAAQWSITHDLDKYPSVTVVDSAGTVVTGDVTYEDNSNLTVDFSAPFSGTAYLN